MKVIDNPPLPPLNNFNPVSVKLNLSLGPGAPFVSDKDILIAFRRDESSATVYNGF
jgi:hypothetical protein